MLKEMAEIQNVAMEIKKQKCYIVSPSDLQIIDASDAQKTKRFLGCHLMGSNDSRTSSYFSYFLAAFRVAWLWNNKRKRINIHPGFSKLLVLSWAPRSYISLVLMLTISLLMLGGTNGLSSLSLVSQSFASQGLDTRPTMEKEIETRLSQIAKETGPKLINSNTSFAYSAQEGADFSR